ncbi:MAG: S8 family serine peptidase [Oligoflexia bacterium]|nr:S8 family serine peptidase [Oligoflexia bacterium]
MRRSYLKPVLAGFAVATSLVALGSAPPRGIDPDKNPALLSATLKNWGLINARGKSHISALDAWKIEEGSRDVVVAVIDTGIDPEHKDLRQNIWQDPARKGEKTFGWNYVIDRANPIDDHGHGTHVAGIVGAVTDPSAGISGVARKVSIMSVKYYSDANPGSVNLRNTVKAINYAVEHGARIINYSGGGPEFSEDEYLAIKKAEARGVLFVAAAGNEHQNTDLVENYYYPSAYKLTNIISVAATDITNNLLPSSNWGKAKVDVAAPGENIYSTLPGGKYGYMSGTSQATAFVSGMAALLLAKDPSLTPQQLKDIIKASVDPIPQLQGKVATGGRVNAYSALLALRNKGQAPTGKAGIIAHKPMSILNLLASTGTSE